MRALAVLGIVLLLFTAGPAAAAEGGACLGPGVGRVLQGLAEAHAFDEVAPKGYRLERLDVKPEQVELGYDDDQGPAVTVVLTVPGGTPGPPPDARGLRFEHRLDGPRLPAGGARVAMLQAAMLVDRSIPPEELRGCRAKRSSYRGAGAEVRAPATVGIALGALQVAIVIAALALGLAGPRRGRRGG